ncbi:uncharacterized protein LOC123510874 [Portunus trituberculatus]|uniref:uncharacterized protein LOC123510874 n=1 Tax=Portunus trituberculatus TaxID=210409 RepID=UPI001E1D0EB5|nr:uncharacterized protein LOC123510874 [Portunus trituberculatus]
MTEPSRSFPKSGHEAMEKVLTDDIVYMSANLNSEIRASQKGRHRFHLARNTFFPQGYGIACFPGAPFKTKFNIMLGRMNQGGLVNKWVTDEVGKLRSTNDINTEDEKKMSYILKKAAARSLTLDHLQGAFIILTAGGIVSALSFLMETLKLYA